MAQGRGPGFTRAEIMGGIRQQQATEEQAEAEKRGTLLPVNDCPHKSVVRATLFKGPKPLHVSYCEDCGALGPTTATPSLGAWVSPRGVFRQ